MSSYHDVLEQVEALNDEDRREPITLVEFQNLVTAWKTFHRQNVAYNPFTWVIAFHLFTDHHDWWANDPRVAFAAYQRLLPEVTNIRVWIELYTDPEHRDSGNRPAEEDCLLAQGEYPL